MNDKSEPGKLRIAAASVIGTTVEWYDLFLFATASALVFNDIFFPNFDPVTGTLLAFGTFASAYIARMLGAIIFGHYGDRIGRKSMLMVSLILMGAATFAIGLLPEYGSIGIWAPIMLLTLRLIQGLALGGEWGGAVLMLVEHAPSDRRGLYGSWVQIGVPAGTLLANLVFLIVASTMAHDDFLSWGWRIPFWASAILIVVGAWVRLSTVETPAFKEIKASAREVKVPLLELMTKSWKTVLLAGVATTSNAAAYVMVVTFGLNYGTKKLGYSYNDMLTIILLACALCLGLLPLFGRLSDRVGRRPVIIGGMVASALMAFPYFWLMETHQFGHALLGNLLLMTAWCANYGPIATFLAERFGTNVRYSGLSISYMLSGVLGSAMTPLVTKQLSSMASGDAAVAWYLIIASLISIGALVLLVRTLSTDLAANTSEKASMVGR